MKVLKLALIIVIAISCSTFSQVEIDKMPTIKGGLQNAEVEKGVNKDLNSAAVSAVKDTKFTPGENDGKKVKAEVTIPIKFKLDDC